MAVPVTSSMNVLRVTHKELTESSEVSSSDEVNGYERNGKKEVKRPAQEFYRPGMGRLQKSPKQMQSKHHHDQSSEQLSSSPRCDKDAQSGSSSSLSIDSRDHNHPIDDMDMNQRFGYMSLAGDSSVNELKDKNKVKRPDQIIYVPRSKTSNVSDEKTENSSFNPEISSDVGFIESMVITNSKIANVSSSRPPKSFSPKSSGGRQLNNSFSESNNNQNKATIVKGGKAGDAEKFSKSKERDLTRINSRGHASKSEIKSKDVTNTDNHSNKGWRESRKSGDRSPMRRGQPRPPANKSFRDLEEDWDLDVKPTAKLSKHFSQEDLKNSVETTSKTEFTSFDWSEQVEAEEQAREEEMRQNSQAAQSRGEKQSNIMQKKSGKPSDHKESDAIHSKRRNSASESSKIRRRQKSGNGPKRESRSNQSASHREQYELPPRFERQKQLAKMQQLERRQSLVQSDKTTKEQSDEKTCNNVGVIRIPNDAQKGMCQAPTPYSTSPGTEMIQRQLFNPNHPNTPTQVMVMKGARDSNVAMNSHEDKTSASSQAHQALPSNPHSPSSYSPNAYSSGYPMPQHPMIYGHIHHPVVPSHPMLPSHWSARNAQAIGKNMREANSLEHELNMLLSRGMHITDFNSVRQCIWKIQVRYETVILSDLEFCTRQNVEQMLWKAAFYQVIEALRRVMSDDPSYTDDAKNKLLKVIEEGSVFYESLLEKQQEYFGFTLSEFLDYEAVRPQSLPAIVKLALVSAQKTLICLGDLARYKEQGNGTTNFGRARNWYLKAQQIAPKNGRPYNQLAILALHARRKLDAVYYYIRSLAASNPFLTAKESLLSLFDDARKKYEQVARKQAEKINAKDQEHDILEDKQNRMEKQQMRTELWIRPDGSTSKCQESVKVEKEEQIDEYAHMSTVDLNKRFVLSFLHVHGKLFTKIGMETLNDAATDMLKQFRALLSRTPTPVGSTRLLQLMAINMFAIANTSLKDTSLETNCRSLLQQQALQVSFQMLSLLLERCVALLKEHMNTNLYPVPFLFCDDLQQLIPAVKVWMDWMICHQHIWMPPPSNTSSDIKSDCKSDVWQLLAETLSIIRTVDMSHIKLIQDDEPEESDNETEVVILTEDTSLAGFVPLMTAPENFVRVRLPADKEQSRNALRVNKLQFFGDYLCGVNPPILTYNVERECYLSAVADSYDSDTPALDRHKKDNFDNEEGVEDVIQTSSDEEENHNECNEIQRLWLRKEKLRKAKARQEKRYAHVQAVIDEHQCKESVVLSIVPKYVIADTNTYIDHLASIVSLVDAGYFQLLVPLVVIGELDGLAKGSSVLKSCGDENPQGYKMKVAENASKSISFLESKFSKSDCHVKAITWRGSILDTIAFRSEDNTENQMTNDDIILNSCLHLCQDDKNSTTIDSNGMKKISRQVVLLTDDRNLRVKAHTQDVPARDCNSFMSWACIS